MSIYCNRSSTEMVDEEEEQWDRSEERKEKEGYLLIVGKMIELESELARRVHEMVSPWMS